MKKSVYILILLLFGGIIAKSQNTYTLKQAQDFATQNSVKVKQALLDQESMNKQTWQTTAIGLPQVNAEVGFQNFLDVPTQVIPASAFQPNAPDDMYIPVQFGTEFNSTAGISISQLIFDGRYFVGLKAKKSLKEFTSKGVIKSKKEIAESVTAAYYTVLVAKESLNSLNASLEKTERLVDDTRKLVTNGFIESTELDQLELTLLNIKNSVSQLIRQESNAKTLLKYEMGLDLKTEIEVTESLETILNGVNPEQMLTTSFDPNQHIDFQLATTQLKLDGLNRKSEFAGYLPTIGAFFQHQQQAFRGEFNFFEDKPWYPSTIWGVNVNIPITKSGGQWAAVSKARIAEEKSANNLKLLEDGLKLQLSTAKSNFASAKETLDLQRKSLEVAEKLQENTLIKFQERVVSSLELTQIQNQYLQTQGSYVKAMFDLLNAKLQLDKILNNY